MNITDLAVYTVVQYVREVEVRLSKGTKRDSLPKELGRIWPYL